MKSMKQILVENTLKKYQRQALRPPKKPAINNKLIAMMLIPNQRIQDMIVGATQSTYVPIPKGDHRHASGIKQLRKQWKRNDSWQGLRS